VGVSDLRGVQRTGRVVLQTMQGTEAIMDETKERKLWLMIRQALLLMVDAIERFLDIRERTAELREEKRQGGR
jgi:hypothetical protein